MEILVDLFPNGVLYRCACHIAYYLLVLVPCCAAAPFPRAMVAGGLGVVRSGPVEV